jgi:hypothetical protein
MEGIALVELDKALPIGFTHPFLLGRPLPER